MTDDGDDAGVLKGCVICVIFAIWSGSRASRSRVSCNSTRQRLWKSARVNRPARCALAGIQDPSQGCPPPSYSKILGQRLWVVRPRRAGNLRPGRVWPSRAIAPAAVGAADRSR
jgi:hypothetical protein